jgi:membrane dipeptidase
MRWTTLVVCFGLSACSSPHAGPEQRSPEPTSVAHAEHEEVEPAVDDAAQDAADDPQARAETLAHEIIILDGHVDVPWRLQSSRDEQGSLTEDITGSTEGGNFDYVRAKKGGLDAPFMSIYVPARYEKKGADRLANKLIDLVEGIAAKHPDKFALAKSVADVRANFADGKISLPMGMENGSPIMGKLANVARFHARGIRYITLAHSKANHISDSSYDPKRPNGGLSRFGKKVVEEMNRVGIMVDVSHLSDAAFEDVIAATSVPVIASHSSCRHFTPGWERNMSDAMIHKLAENGGVIQINFGSTFLDDEIRREHSDHEGMKGPYATVETVADHIDHVVELVGVDHVGFGSDFDGVGDSLPTGLKSPADYPNLIRVLLERDYSHEDIEKICSGNVLRVWSAVEEYAAR